ncbi:MAG: LysR family transcriptional regulator [Clostridia bacterium]|nr:LysR family transcriptional regulator [Clostridia bacterium]
MNYEYYRIFYTVAVKKNITRAAEELYSSQPAISRVISNMEHELNCKLFVRDKTGVKLTREGEELYARIADPCGQLIRADGDFIKFVKLNESTVYVGATVTALNCFLFDFLERYKKKYPNVHFKIHTGSSQNMISELVDGNLDVVFNTTPFDNRDGLIVDQVIRFDDVLIAGNAFSLFKNKKIKLKDLGRLPFILLSKGMAFREYAENFFYENGLNVTPELEADNSALLVPMVANNWGLALVPEKMAQSAIASGSVFKIDLAEPIPGRAVTMVTNHKKPISKPVAQMVKMITSAI